ncbi:SGNH hydrolase-type esterase domain-containing protein [Rozella allomycis CSF55]|uniref:SGNH hydrolase-type esterase domain-containing protein n=1 Tax=Rozella allomycis (strain CSF55) TaxID=988480 RepID=A0A075APD9_ROZAC|nr:SGNH hydrolase-type esterase domain-containing protein [Rozella allomycis CSF55]|eukprot:EPZ31949.1 SGNH hydrolase-type esterase domain-containing protein [Rozella allomycis CSF55]
MCKSLYPTLAIVFLGANDARLSKEDIFFQHVPVEDYKTNLTKIVNLLKAEKLSVILSTPPTLDDEEWNKECIRKGLPSYNRLKENTKLYAIACKEVARAENIPCLDTFSLFENNEENIEKLFSDGLHFSEMGNEIFFKALVEMLNHQGFDPQNLNAFLPYYKDIRIVQKQSEE